MMEGKSREVIEMLPFQILNVAERCLMSQSLNLQLIRGMNDFLPRDYRGLAQLMRIDADQILSLEKLHDPTAYILILWETKSNHTIGDLLSILEELGRYDVIDDLMALLGKRSSELLTKIERMRSHELESIKHLYPSVSSSESQTSQFSVAIVTRDEWEALPALEILPLPNLVKLVIVHQLHVEKSDPIAAAAIQNLQKKEMQLKGASDIGYNFIINDQGIIYEGTGWDRVCGYEFSRFSVSVCLIGGAEATNQQEKDLSERLKALENLLEFGVQTGKLDSGYGLYGVRELDVCSPNNPEDSIINMIKEWSSYGRLGNIIRKSYE